MNKSMLRYYLTYFGIFAAITIVIGIIAFVVNYVPTEWWGILAIVALFFVGAPLSYANWRRIRHNNSGYTYRVRKHRDR